MHRTRRMVLDDQGFADGVSGASPPVLPDDEHEVYWQARRRGVEASGRLARPETFSAYSLAVLAAPVGQRPRAAPMTREVVVPFEGWRLRVIVEGEPDPVRLRLGLVLAGKHLVAEDNRLVADSAGVHSPAALPAARPDGAAAGSLHEEAP